MRRWRGCDGKAVTYGEPMWRGAGKGELKDGDFKGFKDFKGFRGFIKK